VFRHGCVWRRHKSQKTQAVYSRSMMPKERTTVEVEGTAFGAMKAEAVARVKAKTMERIMTMKQYKSRIIA